MNIVGEAYKPDGHWQLELELSPQIMSELFAPGSFTWGAKRVGTKIIFEQHRLPERPPCAQIIGRAVGRM